MNADLRLTLSGALCALAGLAACEVPAPAPRGDQPATLGPGGAGQGQEPANAAPQEAFIAWADGLPQGSGMPPMSVSMTMAMAGDLADFGPQGITVDGMEAEDSAFALRVQVGGDVAGPTRFRIRFDAQMEMAELKLQSGGRPTAMGCNLVGDGETIWLEPDWSKAWFVEPLREQGVGIENMVFSIQVVTVRQLLEALPMVLPEEHRALLQEVYACSASPAALARLTARTSKALSFSQRGGRVRVELEAMPGLWSVPAAGQDGGLGQFMQGESLRGTVEFDQATGTMLKAAYAMAQDGASLSMDYVNTLVAQPFPADHFRYQLPAGRKVFPVDVFMNPIVMQLRRQAGVPDDPANGDFEF